MSFALPIFFRYASLLAQFAVIVVVSQTLSVKDTGIYIMVLGGILGSYFLVGFGAPDGLVKYTSKNTLGDEARSYFGIVRMVTLIGWFTSFLVGVIYGVIIYLFTDSFALGTASAIWWSAYGVVFCSSQALISLNRVTSGTLSFYCAINFSVLFSVIPSTLFVTDSTLLFVLSISAASSFVASFAISVLLLSQVAYARVVLPLVVLQEIVKTGSYIAAGRLLQALLIWSPVWVVGFVNGPLEAAYVGLASRLASAISGILSSIRFSIRPELGEFASRKDWKAAKVVCSNIAFWVSGIVIFAYVIFFFLGDNFIIFFFGLEYLDAWAFLMIFLFGTFGESMGGPVDELLKMSGREKKVFLVQLIIGSLSVIFQVLGAYLFGPSAVVATFSVSFVLIYLCYILIFYSDNGLVVFAMPSKRSGFGLARWARYISYIPPVRLFGKLFHQLALNRIKSGSSVLSKALTCPTDPFSNPTLVAFASSFEAFGDRFLSSKLIKNGIFEARGITYDFGSFDAMCWDNPFEDKRSSIGWLHDFSFFGFAFPLSKENPHECLKILDKLILQLETKHPIDSTKLHFVWTPIALALRCLCLSSVMALIRRQAMDFDSVATERIALHVTKCAVLLERSCERYLGYNHQVFGEAALTVANIGLNRPFIENLAATVEALDRYTLPDGMWAERSPTYHIHMLLIAKSLLEIEIFDPITHEKLDSIVRRMEAALLCVLHPDGDIAIFNDSALCDAAFPDRLGVYPTTERTITLPDAGFARISQGGVTVIFDAGALGPDDCIGHSHGDFLSIEASVFQERLIVDPGVSSISADSERIRTRAASSHNGPTIDGLEPAEFFGIWRVGWRGCAWFNQLPLSDEYCNLIVSGACDGYSDVAGEVKRKLVLSADGCLKIQDTWPQSSVLNAHSRFIISKTWNILEIFVDGVLLESTTGILVRVRVHTGTFVGHERTTYFPSGPSVPSHGTLLDFAPNVDGLLHLQIECVRGT